MQLNQARVVVLLGGRDGEHSVSCVSGQQVTHALQGAVALLLPVYISRTGQWFSLNLEEFLNTTLSLEATADTKALLQTAQALDKEIVPIFGLKEFSPSVVFIALHGKSGEDGSMQGALNLANIPYTGSEMLASALGMHKAYFHSLLDGTSINQPQFLVITKRLGAEESVALKFGDNPVVVKPANLGSSVGVSIAHNADEVPASLDAAFATDETVIVQEYVSGREFTVAVLGTEDAKALPVIEIIPEHEFFDYESKYLSNKTQEVCPAQISEELTLELQRLALLVYKQIGCRHFGRVDFLVRASDSLPFVLEINTIPGLTPSSLLPKAANAAGIPFNLSIQQITESALTPS